MPVSAATLALLMDAGLAGQALLDVVASMDADMAARPGSAATSGAERTRRWREKKATGARDVTVTSQKPSHRDVTSSQVADPSRTQVVILSSEEEERTIPTVCQESPVPSKPKRLDLKAPFQSFWAAYPQRKGSNPRKPAEDKFAAAVKGGFAPEQIIAAAGRYAEECRKDGQVGTSFVAQAVTWLNQRRFEDYAAPPPSGASPALPEPPRPGLPSHEELLAKYSRPADAASEPRAVSSRALPADGASLHHPAEVDREGSLPGDPAERSGMASLGAIFPRSSALEASRDADGAERLGPVNDGPVPVAGMAR